MKLQNCTSAQRKTNVQGYTDLDKQIVIQQLVKESAFMFADVKAILMKFNIEDLPRFYERQIQLLTTAQKFHQAIVSIREEKKKGSPLKGPSFVH